MVSALTAQLRIPNTGTAPQPVGDCVAGLKSPDRRSDP